jgi:hypothetical protein
VHIPGTSLKSLHSCVEVLLSIGIKKNQSKTMVAQRKEIGVSLEHSLVKLPRFFFWEQWI